MVERTRPVAAGAPVVAVHFLDRTAVFVLGEEALLLVADGGDERRVAVQDSGIISSAADRTHVVTGGDDGKVVATDAGGECRAIALDGKRRWIDHVALGPDGAIAWSAGKTAFAKTGKTEPRALDVASTVGGLAFAPKGMRLAIAHYNGVTLWPRPPWRSRASRSSSAPRTASPCSYPEDREGRLTPFRGDEVDRAAAEEHDPALPAWRSSS